MHHKQLFLDCDGVLADFDKGFESHFGISSKDYEAIYGSEKFWNDVQYEVSEFFRNLPVMDGAYEFVQQLRHLRPIILTGCPRGGWAEQQKMAWAREHFPGVPMITCMAKDKKDYCIPGDVLVDDRTHYQSRWEKAGGIFIHHTDHEISLESVQTAFEHVSIKLKGIY